MDVFVEFVGGGFIEDDCVVGLVLDYAEQTMLAIKFWMSCPLEGYQALDSYMLAIRRLVDGVAAYLCPLTTSSSASCRQMLLRVPDKHVSVFNTFFLRLSYHFCGCERMVVVVCVEVRISCGVA